MSEEQKQELIGRIAKGIEECDSMNGTHIFLAREDAIQLIRILSGGAVEYTKEKSRPQSVLFYCADCGKSFHADPREDPECLKKWNYHAWYANCPWCQKEVRQTDMYWR